MTWILNLLPITLQVPMWERGVEERADWTPVIIEQIPDQLTHAERFAEVHTWVFYFLLSVIFLFIIIKQRYSKFLSGLFSSFTNVNISSQVYRDQEFSSRQGPFLLMMATILVLGLALFLLFDRFVVISPFSVPVTLALCCALFGILYFARLGVLKILSYILPIDSLINFYLFNVFLINAVLAMVLLPVVVLIAFSRPLVSELAIVVLISLLVAAVFYRLYRGMQIGRDKILGHKFHFILYLCSLEIIPALVAGKLAYDFFI